MVDTKVADHLLKTTAAVKLLGAEVILTGISAQVARTIVQLGVQISSMHTLSRLAEGIELPEQRAMLRDLRCELGQGYLFSRPLAPPEIEALLLAPDTTAFASLS